MKIHEYQAKEILSRFGVPPRDEVDTKKGTFKCLKFRPMLQEGRVFKDNEDMTVWVSDDKNHLPVRVQTEVLVGSIKMDLVDFENLANPPAIIPE